MNKNEEIKQRLEIMNDALQTALEAILELQTEHKLLSYLANGDDSSDS